MRKKHHSLLVQPYKNQAGIHRRIPKDFLSLTIDTSLLIGGHWWGDSRSLKHGVSGDRVKALDLSDERLKAYAKALTPAMLRIGGTEADRIHYKVGKKSTEKNIVHEFVLRKSLWRHLHTFLSEAGFSLLFTLSAGPDDRDTNGHWKTENAQKLIEYSRRKKFPVAAWELGNEVNAFPFIHGIKHRVSGKQYANDFEKLGILFQELGEDTKLIGPASAIWPRIGEPNPLIRTLCKSTAAVFLYAVSWHWYPQQSSGGRIATRRAAKTTMLNPKRLDEVFQRAEKVKALIEFTSAKRQNEKRVENWVTETANALYGGEAGISDTFVSTLWWLDELGLLARQGVTKVFRQALIGARYGLLDQTSMDPRPDYFASFLWKKLMGSFVIPLQCKMTTDSKLRVYLHADSSDKYSKRTILAINLNRKEKSTITVEPSIRTKKTTSILLGGDGFFTSRTILINGVRAGDELIFDWNKKHIKNKYHLIGSPLVKLDATIKFIKIEIPPITALFFRME